MSSATDIDAPDPVAYMHSTVDPDVVLKELGFRFEGTSTLGKQHWLKNAGRGVWHSVIVSKDDPNVNYRKVKASGRGSLDKEFQVIQHAQVPVSEVRRFLMRWHSEALELIHCLLDADIDALNPRADLDRLFPNRCPACGSTNVSQEADDEGLIDCYDCGIWFDPLHPNNSPAVPGNYPQHESIDPDDPEKSLKNFVSSMPDRHPRITITFSQITPESAEQGDHSDSGWIDEEGVPMEPDNFDYEEGLGVADLAAKYLQREGATEASASFFHPGVWYSTGYQTIDYGTGTEEERNYHLKDFTEDEERQVWNLLHPRRQA